MVFDIFHLIQSYFHMIVLKIKVFKNSINFYDLFSFDLLLEVDFILKFFNLNLSFKLKIDLMTNSISKVFLNKFPK